MGCESHFTGRYETVEIDIDKDGIPATLVTDEDRQLVVKALKLLEVEGVSCRFYFENPIYSQSGHP